MPTTRTKPTSAPFAQDLAAIEEMLHSVRLLKKSDRTRALEVSETAVRQAEAVAGGAAGRAEVMTVFGEACNTLAGLYLVACRYEDCLQQTERALQAVNSPAWADSRRTAVVVAGARLAAAEAHIAQGSFPVAMEEAEEALRLFSENGDWAGKAHALAALGTVCFWRNRQYDKAREYLDQSYDLSKRIREEGTELQALRMLGHLDMVQGRYEEALQQYQKCLELAHRLQDRQAEAHSINNLGNIHYYRGDYPKALDQYYQCLRLTREIEDRQAEAKALHNIGTVYQDLRDYGKALPVYHESLEIKRQLGDRRGQAYTMSNLGEVLLQMEQKEEAFDYFSRARAIADEIEVQEIIIATLLGMGAIRLHEQRPLESWKHFLEALPLLMTKGMRREQAENLTALGSILCDCPEVLDGPGGAVLENFLTPPPASRTPLEWAGLMLERAVQVAEALDSKKELYSALLAQSHWHRLSGRLAEALATLERHSQVKEEVFNQNMERRMKNLEFQLELEQTRRESELHRLKALELQNLNNRLQTANQELTRLNRDISDFLGIAVHDLKNPLGAMVSLVDYLQSELPESKQEVPEILTMIKVSANHMMSIITNLLEYNRLENKNLRLRLEPADLAAYAAAAVESFKAAARSKSIGVNLRMENDQTAVMADERCLQQVLSNLISNAIKFSPSGATVTVGLPVSEDPGRVLLYVRDEGPGIPEADQSKLFQRFARLSPRPTGGETSTGLGLSIVKRMVELMNGRVWCESKPGQGATFHVELPAWLENTH